MRTDCEKKYLLLTLKKNSGFSLVELLVSITIIAMLSGIFLANYKGAGQRSELSLAAHKLASDLRLAQNRSLGSFKRNGVIPNGGWGIYIDKTSSPNNYVFFADDNYPDSPNYIFDQSEAAETIKLPEKITLSHPGDNVSIVFEPPVPKTYINGQNSGDISIVLTDGNTTKTVLVNFFGLVDVIE